MKNLTLAINEGLLRSARRLAVDRGATVNALVRDYLRGLVEEEGRRRDALGKLRGSMRSGAYEVGKATWTREELHD